MDFIITWAEGLAVIVGLMTIIWGIATYFKNVSIVDMFWGLAFLLVASFYFYQTEGWLLRKIALVSMVAIWGVRLSIYLGVRAYGKPEDYRYENFRQKYGEDRYWWISFFQTFLIQGVSIWLISITLLGAQYSAANASFNVLDYIGAGLWLVGFAIELIADIQLEKFRKEPDNYGKVLDDGLWKYSRHPNYFGELVQWIGFGCICAAAGNYYGIAGAVIFTLLTLKITGVIFSKKNVKAINLDYLFYTKRTSKLFPWAPKKIYEFDQEENVG
jgi:steroid 5-alpha reductase family enzyme